jgi:hypothetical protein
MLGAMAIHQLDTKYSSAGAQWPALKGGGFGLGIAMPLLTQLVLAAQPALPFRNCTDIINQ